MAKKVKAGEFVWSLAVSVVWSALAALLIVAFVWAVSRFVPAAEYWWTTDALYATYGVAFAGTLIARRAFEVFARKRRPERSSDEVSRLLRIVNVRTLLALVFGIGLLIFGSEELPIPADHLELSRNKDLIHTLSKEIGFAFIVAIVIWTMFELFNREEEEVVFNSRLEQIKRSVFFSVFKRNFPDQLMDEADKLLLGESFIRPSIDVLYTLTDSECSRDGVDGKVRIVLLNSVARYRVKNVGNEPLHCPNKAALPNPMHPEMKDLVRVKNVHVTIGDDDPQKIDLTKAEEKFRERIQDNSIYDVRFELDDILVGGGKEIEIVWEYTMVKEEEDTEVMRFLFPTGSLNLTIIDRTTSPRLVRARSIHRVDLTTVSVEREIGVYKYSLDHFLLPQQGYMIWWKKDVPVTGIGSQHAATERRSPAPPREA